MFTSNPLHIKYEKLAYKPALKQRFLQPAWIIKKRYKTNIIVTESINKLYTKIITNKGVVLFELTKNTQPVLIPPDELI